jgi:hypothetical protein
VDGPEVIAASQVRLSLGVPALRVDVVFGGLRRVLVGGNPICSLH